MPKDVTGIDEDGLVQGNESEDKFEYLKTISKQSSDPVLLDQKSTMPRHVEHRRSRANQKSAAYLVETLTVLVSYASRFTVRDATSLHFSRLFDKGPFTCTDIENEGATAGVKVVNVTFEEPSWRGSQQHVQQPHYHASMPLEDLSTAPLLLNSKSALYFMYQKYKCVFCLDFSSSMLACHDGGEGIPVDRLADSLEICLKGLLISNGVESPADRGWNRQIYVSVIAHCDVVDKVWSLLQGYLLHPSTLHEALQHVRSEILATETRFRHRFTEQQKAAQNWEEYRSPSDPMNEGFDVGSAFDTTSTSGSSPVTTRVERIAQKCGLALSFLPSDASPLVVLLSDCIFDRKESILYDGAVMQLCRNGTVVHAVQLVPVHDPLPNGMSGDGDLKQRQVKNSSNAFNCFGYVPDGDAIRHLCSVTGGAYFPSMDNLKHAASTTTGAAILERQEKRRGRVRSYSNGEFPQRDDIYRCKISNSYSMGDEGGVFSLSPRSLTVFQHSLLTYLSPLSAQSASILESPLDMMVGGHNKWRWNNKAIGGGPAAAAAARHCNLYSPLPTMFSSLLFGEAGKYTGNVRHEHVLSYALGRVHLRRLLEIRCSEGFRIVDWSFDYWAESSKPRRRPRNTSKSSALDLWGMGGYQDRGATKRVRMTMSWSFGVRLDYLLDIQQLKFKDYSSSKSSLPIRTFDVVAAVNIEVTACTDFARNVKKLKQQGLVGGGVGEADSQMNDSDSTSSAAALLEFVATIKNVDMMLRQVLDFVLSGSDTESPLTSLSRHCNRLKTNLPHGLEPVRSWLQDLSSSEWHRCFILESIEVIYKSGRLSTKHMEDRIEDRDNIFPPSLLRFNTPSSESPLMEHQMAYIIKPDSKEDILEYICRKWSTTVLASGLFLKILSSHHDEEYLPHSRQSPYVHFALLRIAWPLANVATLHLACFSCSSKQRIELVASLFGAIRRVMNNSESLSLLETTRGDESRRQVVYSPVTPTFSESYLGTELKKNEGLGVGKDPYILFDRLYGGASSPVSVSLSSVDAPLASGGRKQFIHKINTSLHGFSTPIASRLVPHCQEVRDPDHHYMEECIPNSSYKQHPGSVLLTYFHRFTCLWHFGTPPRNRANVIKTLVQLRTSDGFDDMGLCDNNAHSTLLAREVNVVLGVLDGEHINVGDDDDEDRTKMGVSPQLPVSGRLLMQYRIFWVDNETLFTELLAEPQLGVVFVPSSSEADAEVIPESKKFGGEWMRIDDFKRDMARYMFESDYTTLTAINTFETVSQGGGKTVPTTEAPEEPKWRDRGKAENVFGEKNRPNTLLRVSLPLSLSHLLMHASVNTVPLRMFHMPFVDDSHLLPHHIRGNSSRRDSSAADMMKNPPLSLPNFCTTCFLNHTVTVDFGIRPSTEKDAEGSIRNFSNSAGKRGGEEDEEQVQRSNYGYLASKDLYSMIIKSISRLNETELPLYLNFFEGGRKGDNTPSFCFHYEPLGYLPQGVAERGHWFYQPNTEAPETDSAILLTFLPRFQDWMAQWRQYEANPKLGSEENSQVVLCRGCHTALDNTEGGGGVSSNKGMVRGTGSLSSINEFYKAAAKEDVTRGDETKMKSGDDKEWLKDPHTTRFLPSSLCVFVCDVKASDFGVKYKFPVGELFSRVKRILSGRGFAIDDISRSIVTPSDKEWGSPYDPSVYDSLSLDSMNEPMYKEKTNRHVSRLFHRSYSFEGSATTNTKFLKVLNTDHTTKNVSSNVIGGENEEYVRFIKELHSFSSAKSMYHALRNGASVCAGDLKRILNVCEELEASLDVSILSSVKLEALRTGMGRLKSSLSEVDVASCSEAADDFDQRFFELLADHFGPIKPRTGYYAYLSGAEFIGEAAATTTARSRDNKQRAGSLFSTSSPPKAPPDRKQQQSLSSSISYAPYLTVPVVSLGGGGGDLKTDDPNKSNLKQHQSLPSSISYSPYLTVPVVSLGGGGGDLNTDDPNKSKGSSQRHSSSLPEKILRKIFPPILVRFELRRMSADGKLRHCVQLSETMGFCEALLQMAVVDDESHHEVVGQTFLFMFLSTFPGMVISAQTLSLQEELISNILSNIHVLMNDEVLRSLLDVTPVTLESLQLVKKCLSPLPPSQLLKFCIPVHLVSLPKPDQRVESAGNKAYLVSTGWDLLQCELLKGGTSSGIMFQRIGDHDVIVVEPDNDSDDTTRGGGYKVPYWALLSVMDNNQAVHELQLSDSVSPKQHHKVNNSPDNNQTGAGGGGATTSYRSSTVTLYAHVTIHLPSLLPGVLDTLRETICQAVVGAVKIVNQRLLLDSLHKTKYASSLLIPSNSELQQQQQHSNHSASSPTGSIGGGEVGLSEDQKQRVASGSSERNELLTHQENDLRPGCFSCSLKFRCQFPLYNRIRDQALERVRAAALEGFLITNRSQLYVYRDSSGSIFYLSLVKEVISGVATGPHEKGEKEKSFLMLSAFGVDEVGDDVAVHLTRVIEQKLDECSSNFLSLLLKRNPNFHLTSLDLEVVKSGGNSGRGLEAAATASCGSEVGGGDDHHISAPPAACVSNSGSGKWTAQLFLPKGIMDVPLFFLYLRQVMCASKLVNPLFTTTKLETELLSESGSGIADHYNDRTTDGGLGSSTKHHSSHPRPLLLPSMAEESKTCHGPNDGNRTDSLLQQALRPCTSDLILLTPGLFTFYINPSVSGLGHVTPCFARCQSIGKGIAIINLSPITMNGDVEWDLPSNATFKMGNFESCVDLQKQCEDEIRSLEGEVWPPLSNSGLNLNPDFKGRTSFLQVVNPTTANSNGVGGGRGTATELDLGYNKSPSSSSCTPSCDATAATMCDPSTRFLKNGSTNQYGIRVEVDACGAIDLPNLLNLIEMNIDQALVDYWIERILLLNKMTSIMRSVVPPDSGIEEPLSPIKRIFKKMDGSCNNSNYKNLPGDHQECHVEVCDGLLLCCPPLPLLPQSFSNPNPLNGLHYIQQEQTNHECLENRDENESNNYSKHHTTVFTEAKDCISSSQKHVPLDANIHQLCDPLGKLMRAGQRLGNPTIRGVYLCNPLPNWAVYRVLKDCIQTLSSCLHVSLDLSLLRFDTSGSCEVVKALDMETLRMMSGSGQPPKSFVGFFGLRLPNCECKASPIGLREPSLHSSHYDTESQGSILKYPSLTSLTSSAGSDFTSEMHPPAFFPWAITAEQLKEAESTPHPYPSPLTSTEDGGSMRSFANEKSKISLDELFNHERVVFQRRVFLVLHLSSRAQSLEVYNLHHVQAERVCEAVLNVMSAAKLQMLALEHAVCQNAGRAPPFTSLYPRKCDLVEGTGATIHNASEQQHHVTTKLLSRLNPKQGRERQSAGHTGTIALYPEIWKRVVSHASTDLMAFSSKLWGMICAERFGGGRMKFDHSSSVSPAVPGSSQLKSSTEGVGPKRDVSKKSIVAATAAAARHRGRHSSTRMNALHSGGGNTGSVYPPSQVNKSSPPRLRSNGPAAVSEKIPRTDSPVFLLSPSLGGRSAWRRHVRNCRISPMSLSLHYDHRLGDDTVMNSAGTTTLTLSATSTTNVINNVGCLPIVSIAKQMETLQCAIAKENIEAQSLSKMMPLTWEGLQMLHWTNVKKKSTSTTNITTCDTVTGAAAPSSQQHRSNKDKKNTEKLVVDDENRIKHDDQNHTWYIPNATVAESLARNARLLDVMVFPLPMDAAAAFKPHYPPSTFYHHQSSNGTLGFPSRSLHHCDTSINTKEKEEDEKEEDQLFPTPCNNKHQEEGIGESHNRVTQEDAVVCKTGRTTTTGLLIGGLFDLLQKKWGHKYHFQKLALACPPQNKPYSEEELKKKVCSIHSYPTTESMPTAAAADERDQRRACTCENSSCNFIFNFPTLRSVAKSTLNHIALGRSVFVSPIVLSSTLLLLDIELNSNSPNDGNNLNFVGCGGSRLPAPQGHHQLSHAYCRLFSVDVLPSPPNNNSIEDGQTSLCCRGLSGLSTFSWFSPMSRLLPQIPSQIAEVRRVVNLGDDLYDYLLESVRTKILSSEQQPRKCYLYDGHSLLADLRILAHLSKLGEESGRSRIGCHFHIYHRELNANGPYCVEVSLPARELMCYLHDHASQYHFQRIGRPLITGGIAKNHNNSTFDHSTGKDVDPESAAIVAFALSLPFSNKESESSNNNIIDMFLLVKDPAMSSDLELVDSVTSYLQEVLALAFCDFRRDLMWKSLTEEMKLNSNICAGDDSHHSHCNNGLHFNSSVAYMNEILEYSAVEDIRKWEPSINKIFNIGLGTSWQEWLSCLQRSKDIRTVCWSEEGGAHLLCSFHRKWDKVALQWRSVPSMNPEVFILVSLPPKGSIDLVTVHLVRRVNEATLNAEQVECLSAFVTSMYAYAALGPASVAL